jgi:hypothetical protein
MKPPRSSDIIDAQVVTVRIGLGLLVLTTTVVVASCSSDRGSAGTTVVTPAAVGTKAAVTLDPVAPSSTSTDGAQPISGSGTFRATREGVDFILMFTGCVLPTNYAARFYDAPDCASALAMVGNADDARDGIASLTCTGTTGFARVSYSRLSTDPVPWTIAEQPSNGNIVGRVLVLETRDAPFQALACGKVVRAPDEAPAAPLPPVGASAELAGLCVWKALQTTSGATCPDANAVAGCAGTHCRISDCVGACADHVSCVEQLASPCDATTPCPTSDACTTCEADLQNCMVGFCLPELSCGPKATPGGPCLKVEQCCDKQGAYAEQCLDAIQLLANLGGDASCSSAMNDWDFITHLHVPCTF